MFEIREIIDRPTVSIIIPAYNAADFIEETIKSVQQQTLKSWEMIIVDDGSTDNTFEIIRREAELDTRIVVDRTAENKGPSEAKNRAIELSKADYVAFLDADDLWLPDKLRKQLDFMICKDIDFSFTQYRQISQDGLLIGELITVPDMVDAELFLRKSVIGGGTVMLTKRCLAGMKFRNSHSEDYIMWMDILCSGINAYGLGEDLGRYRQVQKSRSRNKFKTALEHWDVFRSYLKVPILKASWCFLCWAAFVSARTYRCRPKLTNLPYVKKIGLEMKA